MSYSPRNNGSSQNINIKQLAEELSKLINVNTSNMVRYVNGPNTHVENEEIQFASDSAIAKAMVDRAKTSKGKTNLEDKRNVTTSTEAKDISNILDILSNNGE